MALALYDNLSEGTKHLLKEPDEAVYVHEL